MADTTQDAPVQARCIGDTAIIYASDYLNKLSGERIERECRRQLESGCRAHSIGVSILMGVIDVVEQNTARLIFSDVNSHNANLFEMLGLTRYVSLAKDEGEALSLAGKEISGSGSPG